MQKITPFLSILALLVMASLLDGCKSQKQAYKADFISFGYGGGFAGQETTYKLMGSGTLLSKTAIRGDFSELKTIGSREVKEVFKAVSKVNWTEVRLNNPGNTYRFLSYENGGQTYKLTWGDGKADVPEQVEFLYNKLSALTR